MLPSILLICHLSRGRKTLIQVDHVQDQNNMSASHVQMTNSVLQFVPRICHQRFFGKETLKHQDGFLSTVIWSRAIQEECLISLHFRQSFSCKEMQIAIRSLWASPADFIAQQRYKFGMCINQYSKYSQGHAQIFARDHAQIFVKYSKIISNISRDGTMARLLMAIVVVFLCCHSTKIIVNFYEAVQVNTNR